MDGLRCRDGDLVVMSPVSPGVVLTRLLDVDVDVTVLLLGPTFPRESETDIDSFARESATRVLVTQPYGPLRAALADGIVELIPATVTDYPRVVAAIAARAQRTVGVLETSEPEGGRLTPGCSGLASATIVEAADVLVVEENPKAPRLPGLSFSTGSVDHRLPAHYALPRAPAVTLDERWTRIGDSVATVVPEGATLQLGIGTAATAAATALLDRDDLGLHPGLLGPAVRELVESGAAVRGSQAALPVDGGPFTRPALASLAIGDGPGFYDWLEVSKAVALGGITASHHPERAGANPRFTAINGAFRVDLWGQVDAERPTGRQLSAPGGQPDFFRAAHRSEGGLGIVALPSRSPDGEPAIQPGFGERGLVTSPRYLPDVVVTEHGVADLRGLTVGERASRLVDVAHPDDRAWLREVAGQMG